jgi:hypothetical protein
MPEPRGTTCCKCGRDGPSWALRPCPTCGQTVCTRCAHFEYGRFFCERRCAHYFFHGEAEESDLDEG